MTIVLISIPLMLVAVAIATIPLLVAMRREHRERLAGARVSVPINSGISIEQVALPVAA